MPSRKSRSSSSPSSESAEQQYDDIHVMLKEIAVFMKSNGKRLLALEDKMTQKKPKRGERSAIHYVVRKTFHTSMMVRLL
jgi:hypothetical protein